MAWNKVGNLRGPGMSYKGNYASGTTYAPGDVVYYSYSSWAAKAATKGVAPSTSGTGSTYWGMLTDRGATGPAGEQGIQGPPGTATSEPIPNKTTTYDLVPYLNSGVSAVRFAVTVSGGMATLNVDNLKIDSRHSGRFLVNASKFTPIDVGAKYRWITRYSRMPAAMRPLAVGLVVSYLALILSRKTAAPTMEP